MMELQWPLMIFTLFIALGAGTFGVAGLFAGLGKGERLQVPAVIVALVAVVIGGIASFVHLQHWDRAFNGFGHLSSGITQELIAIVAFVVVAVVYLVLSRGKIPAWAGWLALAVSVILVVVMAHSYNMASRPVWDTPLLWLYYLANALLLGGLIVLVLAGVRGEDNKDSAFAAWIALAGGGVTVVALLAYAFLIPSLASSFTTVGNYFDPTQPTKEMADPVSALSGFLAGGQAALFWGGALIVGAAVPLAVAFLAGKKKGSVLIGAGALGAVCTLAGGVCFRMVLYALGYSVFVFY
jgi:DMSO reductase anchor subunit